MFFLFPLVGYGEMSMDKPVITLSLKNVILGLDIRVLKFKMGFKTGFKMDKKKVALAAPLCAVIAVLYWAPFGWLLNAWLTNSYYSHGLLVLPIIAFLVWRAAKMGSGEEARYEIHGMVLFVNGAAIYLLGYLFQYAFAMALSLVPLCLGIALVFSKNGRRMVFPAHFFLTAVPLPWMPQIGIVLQWLSVHGSYNLARIFWSGAALEYPAIVITVGEQTLRFNVALACSGLNSAISLFALALIISYFLKAPFWKKAALCALSIPYAMLANIVRITITVGVGVLISPDVAEGFFHYASDLVLFIVALLLIFTTCKVLKCLNFERIIPQ